MFASAMRQAAHDGMLRTFSLDWVGGSVEH
jgi:hypothetical protein